MKLDEFQQLGKDVKFIVTKFAENPGKFTSLVLQMYWDAKQERDAYKHQRDELIKDIAKLRERNAELERKAQAFDEILEIVEEEDCWAEEFAAYVSQIIDNYKEEQ